MSISLFTPNLSLAILNETNRLHMGILSVKDNPPEHDMECLVWNEKGWMNASSILLINAFSCKFKTKIRFYMSLSQAFIQEIESKYPIFLRANDLIEIGLYKSRSDLCIARESGNAPPHIRISSHKIVYSRAAVLEWIKKKAEKQ